MLCGKHKDPGWSKCFYSKKTSRKQQQQNILPIQRDKKKSILNYVNLINKILIMQQTTLEEQNNLKGMMLLYLFGAEFVVHTT